MAKKSKQCEHKQLNDLAYDNRYNENVSYIPKNEVKFEHDIDAVVKYVGGIHTKGALCKITKQMVNKSIIYYSVIFEGTTNEVNWIRSHLLKKIEVQNIIEGGNSNEA